MKSYPSYHIQAFDGITLRLSMVAFMGLILGGCRQSQYQSSDFMVLGLQGLRLFILFLGLNNSAWLLGNIDFSLVMSIRKLVPLCVFISALVFYKEAYTKGLFPVIVICLIASVLLLSPGNDYVLSNFMMARIGLDVFCWTFYLATQKVINRFMSPLFQLTVMGLIIGLLSMPWIDVSSVNEYHWAQWSIIFFQALVTLTGQLSFKHAFSFSPTSLLMPIEYLGLPIALLFSHWVFDEKLSFTLLLAASMILTSNLWLFVVKSRSLQSHQIILGRTQR